MLWGRWRTRLFFVNMAASRSVSSSFWIVFMASCRCIMAMFSVWFLGVTTMASSSLDSSPLLFSSLGVTSSMSFGWFCDGDAFVRLLDDDCATEEF